MAISGISTSAPRAAGASPSIQSTQKLSQHSADIQKLLKDLKSLTGANKASGSGQQTSQVGKADQATKPGQVKKANAVNDPSRANRPNGVDPTAQANKVERTDKTNQVKKSNQATDLKKLDQLMQKIEKLHAQLEKLKGTGTVTAPGNGNPGVVPPNAAQSVTASNNATQGTPAVQGA